MKQYNQNLNFLQTAQLAQMYSNPFMSNYLQAQQTNMLSAGFMQQLSALTGMAASVPSVDPLQMNVSQKQYEEMAEMLRKMTQKEVVPKKPINSSGKSETAAVRKGEHPAAKKHKLAGDSEMPCKKQKCDDSKSGDLKKAETAPSVSILPLSKEMNASTSCVSAVSIIPKNGPANKETAKVQKVSKKTEVMRPVDTPLSVIMPPPIHSPLSISNLTPKQPSPRKSLSPKDTGQILKNIEATISRVPVDPAKNKTAKVSPGPQLPKFGLEPGLLKFPASLSVTPQHLEIQQSRPGTSEASLPKLPSSITLTPAQPKLPAGLEVYKKTAHPRTETKSPVYPTKNADLQKVKSRGKKTDVGIPFNVDSMLQTTPKQAAAFGFGQHLTPQAAHTSVITSTSVASDCKISPLFSAPNPMTKTSQNYAKKTSAVPRSTQNELYKVNIHIFTKIK